ncbi:universal stress protein [Desulfonema magnum]|uniref:Universal stress protein, UspA-like n=1 Tax=Desulfonema magnum TaxID=45655 RepID=A0A975BSC2_9BACT|nr:universal stress protein [Desulfonema magnum]QTA90513.1 Universal stress protein, UspA-like [Desulfonema magnum]
MTSQKILLPYNFTSEDQKAAEFVIRTFAHQKDVEITLFNTYIPAPQIEVRGSPIMEKMMSNVNYLSKKIDDQEAALKTTKEELIRNGFSEDRIRYIFEARKKDVARDIVDLCRKDHFDMVVLNRSKEKVGRFFTGSVFSKVVGALEDMVVCVVT